LPILFTASTGLIDPHQGRDNLDRAEADADSWAPPWTQGLAGWETGNPLVNAGMRKLWQSGWMGKRVRMVAFATIKEPS